MAVSQATTADAQIDETKIRHAKDDALDSCGFELLIEGAHALEQPYRLQCRTVILLAGRLGLRAGEIAHMKSDWIDFRRRSIEIPRYETCTKARDGDGICGYCRQAAEQMTDHNPDMSLAEAKAHMWQAKTDAAARRIPYDIDPRIEIVLERFADKYDEYPHSRQSVNRRVERAASAAVEISPDELYPHALRATAATRLAGQGVDTIALKGMMGWSQFATARSYISDSGENTARAVRAAHSH